MIDGGTTTYQLAEFISGRRLRVITNSLVIAQAIDQFQGSKRGAEVLLCGGTLQPESGIVAGSAAESFLKRYRANWLFLGCAGVDADRVTNYEEAVLASEKLMIERSARLVLMADHTKVGRAAMTNRRRFGSATTSLTSPPGMISCQVGFVRSTAARFSAMAASVGRVSSAGLTTAAICRIAAAQPVTAGRGNNSAMLLISISVRRSAVASLKVMPTANARQDNVRERQSVSVP